MTEQQFGNHDLPKDIIVTVLSLLSVKTLARFRCVCKSWLNLIQETEFISTYAAAQKNNVSYIFRADSVFLRWNQYLDKEHSYEILVPPVAIPPGSYFGFHGACNGLVCFSLQSFDIPRDDTVYFDLFIWNPSTSKLKAVNPGSNMSMERFNRSFYVVIGFGSCKGGGIDDYKVVKYTRQNWESKDYLYVYTLSTNSWKKIDVADNSFHSALFPACVDPGTWIDETLHWVVTKVLSKKLFSCVMTFDLQREVLVEIALPEAQGVNWGLGIFGESLSSVSLSLTSISFWVLKERGKENSWTKLYTFDTTGVPMIRSTSCIRQVNSMNVLTEVWLGKPRITMFDFERKRWINLGHDILDLSKSCQAIAYTESLASLDEKWWRTDEDNKRQRRV